MDGYGFSSSAQRCQGEYLQCSWPFLNGHGMTVAEAGFMFVFRESVRGERVDMNEIHF